MLYFFLSDKSTQKNISSLEPSTLEEQYLTITNPIGLYPILHFHPFAFPLFISLHPLAFLYYLFFLYFTLLIFSFL